MGGSSLAPEVLAMTFGKIDGFPRLHVLDSTDPVQIRASEDKLDLANTFFIVSSKSGSTLEPNIFKQYFLWRLPRAAGTKSQSSLPPSSPISAGGWNSCWLSRPANKVKELFPSIVKSLGHRSSTAMIASSRTCGSGVPPIRRRMQRLLCLKKRAIQ